MPEETHNKENAIQEEIKALERALAEKKKALLSEGAPTEQKELFRETFREQYREALETPAVPGGGAREGAGAPASGATGPAALHEDEIQKLIQFAFEKGIAAAILRAKEESPWLLDELHDRLIDEYYQKLVASRAITEAS